MPSILRPKATLTIAPTVTDRELIKQIIDRDKLDENLSATAFLRHCIELSAKAVDVIAIEAKTSSAEADLLSKVEELTKELSVKELEVKSLKDAPPALPAPTPKPVEQPTNKVLVPITDNMEKALKVRQNHSKSKDMEHMCSQAIKYCIRYPLHDLFTGSW